MRALLVGNYGAGNVGDEMLRQYFLERFPEIEWTTVSSAFKNEAGTVPPLPTGFRSFFLTPWWKTVAALRRCDAAVFGGGTLFTDIESVCACMLWGLHALVAACFSKRVILAFQGVGPFRTKLGEGIARWVFARAAFVSVRDGFSEERVRLMGVVNVLQSFDPVILLLHEKNHARNPKNVFTIIPRQNSSFTFCERAKDIFNSSSYETVEILSFQPESSAERCVLMQLESSLPDARVVDVRTIDDVIGQLSASAFVLTARYHGAIAAMALGVPFEAFASAEGDKLSSLGSGDPQKLREMALAGEAALRRALFVGNIA